MYDAFDGFLRVDTWHTQHRLDEERFFRALRTVVERNDFNPDALGTYIDEKRAEREFRLTDLSEEQYEMKQHAPITWLQLGLFLLVFGPLRDVSWAIELD